MSDYNAEKDISTYNKKLNECLSNRLNAYQTELGNWQEQLDMMKIKLKVWQIIKIIFHTDINWKISLVIMVWLA